MTRDELISFGKSRHGEYWIGPLAKELGYCFSQIWKVSAGKAPVTRRLELEVERLRSEAA